MPTCPEIKIISDNTNYTFEKMWYELADASHFWMQWRLAALKNQLSYLNIPLESELAGVEIGCGEGVLRGQLRDITSWTIDGIDLDSNALKLNKEGDGQLFLYNILEKNQEFENKYDFLFLYDVLEHIEDTQMFLKACLFHLKKGGYLFINVPALDSQKSVYDKVVGHLRRYNRKTLSNELIKADLEILDTNYWGFLLLPLLFLRKLTSSDKKSDNEIIKQGFKPPHKLVSSFLKVLMTIETFLFKKVPLGISIMAVAQKK